MPYILIMNIIQSNIYVTIGPSSIGAVYNIIQYNLIKNHHVVK